MSVKLTPTLLTVEITRDSIVHGKCYSAAHCMLGLEIATALTATSVRVQPNRVSFSKDGYRHEFAPPKKAVELLLAFDNAKTPEEKDEFAAKIANTTLKFKRIAKPRKITPAPDWRKQQINVARHKRALNGTPDVRSTTAKSRSLRRWAEAAKAGVK